MNNIFIKKKIRNDNYDNYELSIIIQNYPKIEPKKLLIGPHLSSLSKKESLTQISPKQKFTKTVAILHEMGI